MSDHTVNQSEAAGEMILPSSVVDDDDHVFSCLLYCVVNLLQALILAEGVC